MVSQATKRAWRRVAAGLFLLPAMAGGGIALWAQGPMTALTRPADKAGAQEYLKKGRAAFNAGDFDTARQYALAAQQYRGKWDFWQEDTPEKLLGDIGAQIGGGSAQPLNAVAHATASGSEAPALMPVGATETPKPVVNYPTDARQLVKMGREFLKQGRLDLAEECAKRASAIPTRWGLFEFNAEKLTSQVAAAKADHTRIEAEQTLVEARKLYYKGDYDKALELAHKAEKMHGTYSTWDISDRPAKLVAEIDAAKARQKRSQPASALPGSVTNAAKHVETPKPADTPKPMDFGPAVSTPKRTALALMVESRALEKANRLVDARAKALEAQKLNVGYDAGEDRPEVALMEYSKKAAGQINTYADQAMQFAGAQPTAEKAAQAQNMLSQARAFAMGMGFETKGIDEKIKWLSSVSANAPRIAAKPIADQKAQGRDMLAKAQLELRNGQYDAARKLAEAVFAGGYGLNSEAAAIMRLCEVEQHNKQIQIANQSYDAGMGAFQRGEYQQATQIFMQIDGTLLTTEKKGIMNARMAEARAMASRPAASSQIVRTSMPGDPPPVPGRSAPPPIPPLPVPGAAGDSAPGVARATDQPRTTTLPATPMNPPMPGADNYAAQLKALQQVEFQRLRAEGLKVQREAQTKFGKGETDAAIQMLQEYQAKVKEAQLDPTDQAMLQRPIEYRVQHFKVLKSQRDSELALSNRRTNREQIEANRARERDAKYKTVADLMKQYHGLMEEKKFSDAELLAMKAQELDPDSDIVHSAVEIAKMAKRHLEADKLKAEKEEFFNTEMNDTEHVGPAVTIRDPLRLDPEHFRNRSMGRPDGTRKLRGVIHTEREKEIERKLSTPVTVDFNNTSLRETVKYLQQYLRMNIVFNQTEIMRSEGVNPEQPVSLKVDAVPLKSVLNLILKQAKLTYVIADDVLQVVTLKEAQGKLTQKIYPVADLVIPIDNYAPADSTNLLRALDRINGRANAGPTLQTYQPPSGLNNSMPTNPQMSTQPGSQLENSLSMGGPVQQNSNATSISKQMPTNTIEQTLMKLVTNTVSPHSWSDVGGSGTIDYYPIGHALVINQLEDVQEQIADLLDQLRRLQDLEVAIEVRIVSVSESFFERIGMDFSLNIKTDSKTKNFEPQLTSGQFKPEGFLNDPHPKGVIAGLTPAGTLTSDLDVPLRSSSFNMAIPPFGFPNSPGANGGLSLGLAFLNDIQVFMFMEAAQGDRRFNVMQAPKLTAANGQSSTITITDFQFFVTDVVVFNIGGQVIFRPQNTPLPVGGTNTSISLAMQPVVSADRRYVRINMNPSLSSLSSALVPLFPVTAFITPVFEGGFVGQPIPFTQFVQQPSFNNITVSTTVSVPDGGTVVLGGLKTLNEGRNEFGPPILSKIPYLNRLFRNTGYGRDAQNMLIMVTPRIIINREEAERQVGEPQDALLP